MCAVLKTLHSERHFITEEEYRRVGEVELWQFDKLALIIGVKAPGVLQQALDALEGYTKDVWYWKAAKCIRGMLKYSCIFDVVRMGEGLLHFHALLKSSLLIRKCTLSYCRCKMDQMPLPPLHTVMRIRFNRPV